MSAENMICVQKRNGRYWVWMGFTHDVEHKPAKSDARFMEHDAAMNYAREWIEKAYVEHGLLEISDL